MGDETTVDDAIGNEQPKRRTIDQEIRHINQVLFGYAKSDNTWTRGIIQALADTALKMNRMERLVWFVAVATAVNALHNYGADTIKTIMIFAKVYLSGGGL